MHQITIDKYTDILDDYLRIIKLNKSPVHWQNIVNYFYSPITGIVIEDSAYFIWQFEKVIRCLEEEEKYEECAEVMKVLKRLNNISAVVTRFKMRNHK